MLERIGAAFVDKDEFNEFVQIVQGRINSRPIRGYHLRLLGDVRDVLCGYFEIDIDSDKAIEIYGVAHSPLLILCDFDMLAIENCYECESVCNVLSIQQGSNKFHISRCNVVGCRELEYLFCSSGVCILCSSLQGLNELYLCRLSSLSMLCKENEVASSFLPFSYLTKLSIEHCDGMKKLLTPGMSTQLRNLEEIDVQYCKSMEEIFSTWRRTNFHDPMMYCESMEGIFSTGRSTSFHDPLLLLPVGIEANEVDMDDTNFEAINLPNLKSVRLRCLTRLKSVCKGTIVCGSLKEFKIIACPTLERVP